MRHKAYGLGEAPCCEEAPRRARMEKPERGALKKNPGKAGVFVGLEAR